MSASALHRVGLHVFAAPQEVGEEGLRARVALLAQHRQPVLGVGNVALDAVAVQVELGELELGVLVAEELRRFAQILHGDLRVRLEVHLGQAVEQIAGDARHGLGNVRRALVIVGIDVGVLLGDLQIELVGLGVVGARAVVVGVDARQVVGRKKQMLIGRVLERRNGNLVIAAVEGADALVERVLRRSVLGGSGAGAQRAQTEQEPSQEYANCPIKYPHSRPLQLCRRHVSPRP